MNRKGKLKTFLFYLGKKGEGFGNSYMPIKMHGKNVNF